MRELVKIPLFHANVCGDFKGFSYKLVKKGPFFLAPIIKKYLLCSWDPSLSFISAEAVLRAYVEGTPDQVSQKRPCPPEVIVLYVCLEFP